MLYMTWANYIAVFAVHASKWEGFRRPLIACDRNTGATVLIEQTRAVYMLLSCIAFQFFVLLIYWFFLAEHVVFVSLRACPYLRTDRITVFWVWRFTGAVEVSFQVEFISFITRIWFIQEMAKGMSSVLIVKCVKIVKKIVLYRMFYFVYSFFILD